ncbi:MAG TPA: N-acetyl-gamma-glutamyl-phosphate reductase [Spirochaetota bacterium]|nr:N-acetyl-gamma-glutamyl-phosphate reductase [Spirochaetota bacterium]
MKKKIFIDGQAGTTGLTIYKRLQSLPGLELLKIPAAKRKDAAVRAEFVKKSDIAVLCLPDAASRELIPLLDKQDRVIDTSTAFRTSPDWVYGFPELQPDFYSRIKAANRVANPGCYATGFIAAVKPLIDQGLIDPGYTFCANAVSGYSGGGKKLIALYETDHTEVKTAHYCQYKADLNHKHVPEMTRICALKNKPLFTVAVDHFYKGMVVNVALPSAVLDRNRLTRTTILKSLQDYYRDCPGLQIKKWEDAVDRHGFLAPANRITNPEGIDIIVMGQEKGHLNLCARLDNLAKGAGGAAVQNLLIMLDQA